MEGLYLGLNSLCDVGNGGWRVMVTVELFNKVSDLPGRNAFPVQCDNRCFQIIRSSGVLRDQLLVKTPLTISCNEKVKLSIPGIELPLIVTVPAIPGSIPLSAVLFITQEVRQFGFEEIVHGFLEVSPEELIQRFMIQHRCSQFCVKM